jgi:hypothetical protein
MFVFGPPRQFHRYGHTEDALKGALVHQAVTYLLLKMEHAYDRMYLDNFNSRTARWVSEMDLGKMVSLSNFTEHQFFINPFEFTVDPGSTAKNMAFRITVDHRSTEDYALKNHTYW